MAELIIFILVIYAIIRLVETNSEKVKIERERLEMEKAKHLYETGRDTRSVGDIQR